MDARSKFWRISALPKRLIATQVAVTVLKVGTLAIRRNVDVDTVVQRNPRSIRAQLGIMKRNVQGGWKERYCVLGRRQMDMYRSKDAYLHREAPTQTIFLDTPSSNAARDVRACVEISRNSPKF